MELLETVATGRGAAGREKGHAPETADQYAAHIIWTASKPMLPQRRYLIRFADASAIAQVTEIVHRVDMDTMQHMAARTLGADDIGYCKLSLDRPVELDIAVDRRAGIFSLADRLTGEEVGTGAIEFALRRAANIVRQALKIDKAARSRAIGQRPCVLWMTGLSGAGKSTVADRVEQKLHAQGRRTYLLDGDNVRLGLNRDLGFTERDRVENIRRVAEVAKLMADAGLIVIVSFISPFRSDRSMARDLVEDGEFLEIFVDTPLGVCEARDPKGLYAKARSGDLVNFTGIWVRQKDNPGGLGALYLFGPNGTEVPLSAVVTVTPASGYDVIRRERGRREVSVTAEVDETVTTNNVVLAALRRDGVAKIAGDAGLEWRFAGKAEEQAETFADMGVGAAIGLAGMFLVLAWIFGSYSRPLAVLAVVPLGFIGVSLGHFFTGFDLTVLSMIGMIGLSGIVINDSIVLIVAIADHEQEGKPPLQAIEDGCCDRLRAVILTSLTTISGLLPLCFETSLQAQFLIPVALTIVAGLATATLLILFVVPAMLAIGHDLRRLTMN